MSPPGARLVLAGVWLLLATGCASTAPSAGSPQRPDPQVEPPSPVATARASPRGGSLRIGVGEDPAAIAPWLLADRAGDRVANAVFDSLVALNQRLEPVPAAASGWEVSDDGRTYRFTLRPGGRFHDGDPVVAGDFVRAFNRVADGTAAPRSFNAGLLGAVAGFEAAQRTGTALAGVEALDRRHLRIRLRRPDADFLTALADPSLAPIPPEAVREPERYAQEPIGNGPFAMTQPWEHDDFVRLERAPDHPDPARLEEVVFQIYPSDAAGERQYGAYREGGLDVATVPATARTEADGAAGAGVGEYAGPGLIDGATLSIYFLGFDLSEGPFDRGRLRRAVSRAIDREGLVEDVLHGTRVPLRSVAPPPLDGVAPEVCGHCRHDPEQARALWAEADAADGTPESIRLLHNRGSTHERIVRTVAGQIEATLPVSVTTAEQALQPYLESVRAGAGDVFRFGWQPSVPTLGAVLRPLFHSRGSHNLNGYASAGVDRLLDRARGEGDDLRRLELLRQAETRILADAPLAPLFAYRHHLVVAESVRGLQVTPDGRLNLAEVWVDRP